MWSVIHDNMLLVLSLFLFKIVYAYTHNQDLCKARGRGISLSWLALTWLAYQRDRENAASDDGKLPAPNLR